MGLRDPPVGQMVEIREEPGLDRSTCRYGAEGPLQIWADPEETTFFALAPGHWGVAYVFGKDGTPFVFSRLRTGRNRRGRRDVVHRSPAERRPNQRAGRDGRDAEQSVRAGDTVGAISWATNRDKLDLGWLIGRRTGHADIAGRHSRKPALLERSSPMPGYIGHTGPLVQGRAGPPVPTSRRGT